MLLGNTLEVVYFFFFKLGECSLLTYVSLMSKQRGAALFVPVLFRPSRSSSKQFSASFSSSHMMYPTLPPKSSPAASGRWLTPLCPVLQALQSLTVFPLTSPAPTSIPTPSRVPVQFCLSPPGHPVPYSLLLSVFSWILPWLERPLFSPPACPDSLFFVKPPRMTFVPFALSFFFTLDCQPFIQKHWYYTISILIISISIRMASALIF